VNTYTGPTLIDNGILRATTTTALPSTTAVTLANAAGTSLHVNSLAITVGSLAGGGALGGNVTLGTGGVLTVGDATSTTFSGAVSGAGSLIKTGSGTLTLDGSLNTYSAGTTVNAGTLLVNNLTGSGTGTGAIVVNGTSTLGGSGFIAPSAGQDITLASTAVLSVGNPGSSVAETLDISLGSGSDLYLAGATLELGLYSNQSGLTLPEVDRLNVNKVGGGASVVNLTGSILKVANVNGLLPSSFNVNDSWKLFDWAGLGAGMTITGTFSNLTPTNFTDFPDLGSGKFWDFSQIYNTGVISVVVPEPQRLMLLFFAFLGMGWRRRRRI
jgi:autotransporter-associated beta strand protein